MTDRTTPIRIHADRTAGTLEIAWADDHVTTFGATALRWLCPCAYCRGEAGMPGWLDSRPTLTAEQTRLVDLQLVGQYAVAPSWGDGHQTGYYTFALLRDRCPCPVCTAGRASDGRPHDGSTADQQPDHAVHAPLATTTEGSIR
ncbi:MAG: gamma-butyrobetaine hydroxylase-like domain-containing protein [Candidatus Limnocylindrales bacterium]